MARKTITSAAKIKSQLEYRIKKYDIDIAELVAKRDEVKTVFDIIEKVEYEDSTKHGNN